MKSQHFQACLVSGCELETDICNLISSGNVAPSLFGLYADATVAVHSTEAAV